MKKDVNVNEGTSLLIHGEDFSPVERPVKRGKIRLTDDEMASGVTKIVDFGTGQKYEIAIPAGVKAGKRMVIKGTGIKDENTGLEYIIELTVAQK